MRKKSDGPARARVVESGAQAWRAHLRARQSVGTCADLFGLWLEDLARLDSKSLSDARSVVRVHLLPAFGPEPLSELCTEWVDALSRALLASGLAPYSVRRIISMLSSACAWAVKIGAMAANPCRGVELPARPRKSPRAEAERLTLEQLSKLVYCRELPWDRRLLWAGLGLTGMRIGEASAASVADLEHATPLAKIWIRQAWHQKSGRVRDTKTGETRAVPVPEDLARLLDAGRGHFRISFGRPPGPQDPLFPRLPRQGRVEPKAWHQSKALKRFKEDCQTVGLAPTRFGARTVHCLRHTYVSAVARTTGTTPAAQALTHEVHGSAYWRYVHLDWADLCAAVRELKLIDGHQLALL